MFSSMEWLNEPPAWQDAGDVLTLRTGAETDFWRKTHYGFIRDTGHFLHREVTGDFTAAVTFSGEFTTLYDQAGLMLRLNERTWIKAGVEYSDGALQLSTVVTNGTSDWSLRPLGIGGNQVTLQLSREANAVHVSYLEPQGRRNRWSSLRLAYLPLEDHLCRIGIMACSPTRAGLDMEFSDFRLCPSAGIDLHPHDPADAD